VLFTKQIAQAKAAGIVLISDATGDGPTPGVLADLGGQAQETLYGKLVAAYFVVSSGGKGKAGVFNIQALPILTDFVKAFQQAVTQWCPGCSTKAVDQQLTDEATKTPSNVVAFLQRNPDYKWAVFGNGDLSQGVRAAIASAGLPGVSIIGEVPTEANIANVKAGTESAWAGYTVDILNWRLLDILARHFNNSDVTAAAAVPLSMQILTSANVKSAAYDNGGYYLGVADYAAQFKKIWHLN
jgi:ribose transport system substrate-binding protein